MKPAPILGLCLALAAMGSARGQEDAQRGKAFVEKNCANCHAVGETGASKHKDAPPFRVVARKYDPEDLAESFAEGIVVGHKDMPEFEMNTGQIAVLIAYFKELARAAKR